MSDVRLRFSTSILKRLGEELNPNIDQGLIELAKNSYDADATKCTIELIDTHDAGGTIRITDDGLGMDDTAIRNGWLLLGRSPKTIAVPTKKFGRTAAGSKGLGRLAALRMGSQVSLITRPVDDKNVEYHLEIDWEKFEEYDIVEDVILNLEKRKRDPRTRSGTVVNIRNLNPRVTRSDAKRLARGLLLLADPFIENPEGFRPILKAPEFEDLEKLVEQRYFDDAEFHLRAELDSYGKAEASVVDWKGQPLYSAEHGELCRQKQNGIYRCPPSHFDLWAFILDRQTFAQRQITMKEVQSWLGEFGGVHLYINGLRVAPYGNPGHDWLDMNLKRVRSPELRPSTNTAIGRISIADTDEMLIQKTDRSGLIEGETYQELRRFAIDALNWMAKCRLAERERLREKERVEAPKSVVIRKTSVDKAVSELPLRYRETIQQPLVSYERAREKEAKTLRREVQLYRTMSTAGITASTFAHESTLPIRLIIKNAGFVKNRCQEFSKSFFDNKIEKPLGRIVRQARTLRAFANSLLGLVDYEKRRISRTNLHDIISNILKTYDPLLKDRDVKITRNFDDGNPYLRTTEAAIESIVTNLLTNSLKAFVISSPRKRIIEIRTEIIDTQLTLRVLDNGPGIREIDIKDIWLPGETTYPNGTGLGLTIVRDTVRDLGGSVHAVAEGELGGAEIIIELPILGV